MNLGIKFFLPEDSLLFPAGFLASQDILNLQLMTLGCFVGVVLGDSVGYASGQRFGRKLFSREDFWRFRKKPLSSAQGFYKKHGKKAIVLTRFVRLFAPLHPLSQALGQVLVPWVIARSSPTTSSVG